MIIIILLFTILIWYFFFYQFILKTDFKEINKTLKIYFDDRYLIKQNVKSLFKKYYNKEDDYFNFYSNKIYLWHEPNWRAVLNWFLIYNYSQILDKDKFWDKIYNLLWNNSIVFNQIENEIYEKCYFYRNEIFYKELYLSIFWNLYKFWDNNTIWIIKDIYYLK